MINYIQYREAVNMEKIRIDFVSDVVCPWCAIGYKRLTQAIAETGLQDKVDIVWHPFFLNPDMPQEGENNNDYGARKYNRSLEESRLNRERITAMAKDNGLTFNLDDNTRVINTYKAHVALEYARQLGKQTALKERLFTAFFTEKKDISKTEALEQEMRTVGLELNDSADVFNNQDIQNYIEAEVSKWQAVGISSVPTMFFNQKLRVNGSQTIEGYKQILTEAMAH
ncbi:MAG: putative DsbA family dithiol-disulfide isomerase [Colwellia sp.]|jgi:predicted DsbA family dithiol-disulfide isomerase|tara:strand:- start:1281 stop:1958 length:678 start_codon:yes stop_codon:yes gene_type:complete